MPENVNNYTFIYDGSNINGDNITWRCVIEGALTNRTLIGVVVEGGDGAFRNTYEKNYLISIRGPTCEKKQEYREVPLNVRSNTKVAQCLLYSNSGSCRHRDSRESSDCGCAPGCMTMEDLPFTAFLNMPTFTANRDNQYLSLRV